MADQDIPPIPETLPVMATTGLVLFPYMMAPLNVGRPPSLRAVDAALSADRLLCITMQRDEETETPTPAELHEVGCACAVMRMARTPEGAAQIIVQGLVRVRLSDFEEVEGVLRARLQQLPDDEEKPMAVQALMNNLLMNFRRIVELHPVLPEEAFAAAQAQDAPGKLADFVASTLNLEADVGQQLLEELDVQKRLERVTALATNEINVLELSAQIQNETRKELDKGQREFILRQQLREIQKQLGEGDDREQEVEELRQQIEAAGMPEEARKAADRELERLSRMPPAAAEYSVSRNYLDYLIAVPWSKSTEDNLDITHAAEVLDAEHYGLEEAKDRVLEYLAVRRLKADSKGPILCFVGPPGVGKTSLANSIAHALGRRNVRMALGGVRDEAEIRGHRRTYIGALPGRIVQGLRDAGTNNPVMVLDEIDKLGADYRGDPTSALLEVLDPQQNHAFKDHYLEVPVDLSRVMFITTANILDTIPAPLRDRMEVLRLPGYTEEEKVQIAARYLYPRQREEAGLTPDDIVIETETIRQIVRTYTREAGVRNLEREIGRICRKIARQVALARPANPPAALGDGSSDPVPAGEAAITAAAPGQGMPTTTSASTPHVIGPEDLEELLGPARFQPEMGNRAAQIGVATGLAWTPMGGEILFIETARVAGRSGLVLTGQLGEVMKESARIALDYLRSRATDLKIPLEEEEIHVHVPAGAIPKDGPSAGIAITAALASLLCGRPARHDMAMTGEVTLTGRVLPIGGVKEKVLAARQAGIRCIILPERNRPDLRDIPETIRQEMDFIFVEDVRDALQAVLLSPEEAKEMAVEETSSTATPLEQEGDVIDPAMPPGSSPGTPAPPAPPPGSASAA